MRAGCREPDNPKTQYLTPNLRRLLCNALIQLHFDYVCSAWYPNLSKKLKTKNRI